MDYSKFTSRFSPKRRFGRAGGASIEMVSSPKSDQESTSSNSVRLTHVQQNNTSTVNATYQDIINDLLEERTRKHRKTNTYHSRFRNWLTVAYVFVFLVVVGIVIYAATVGGSVTKDRFAESVNELCSVDELEDCRKKLQDQLSTGYVGVLRQPIHFTFTLAALLFVMLVGFFVLALRARRKRKRLHLMPKDNIDLWTVSASTTRQECFSKEMFRIVNDELERVKSMSNKRYAIPVLNGRVGDVNWGKTISNVRGTHFPTSIALSFQTLNEFAKKHHRSLRIGPNETVRDFMGRIKKQCKGIVNESLCDEYVQLYEEARFGNSTISQERYAHFLRVVYPLFHSLEESHTADGITNTSHRPSEPQREWTER